MAASSLRRGEPFVWLTASALAAVTMLAVTFVVIILANALGFFWPGTLVSLERDGQPIMLGQIVEIDPDEAGEKIRVKVGNRDLYGQDFVWLPSSDIVAQSTPADAIAIERHEYGHFYGYIAAGTMADLASRLDTLGKRQLDSAELRAQIAAINRRAENMRRQRARLTYQGEQGQNVAADLDDVETKIAAEDEAYEKIQATLTALEAELRQEAITLRDAAGTTVEIPLVNIVRVWHPNTMS